MTEFMQIKNNNDDYFFIKKVDDDSYEIITQFSHHEASNYQIIVSSYDGVIGGSLDFLESFLARNRFSDKEIEKIVNELLEIVDVSNQGLETLEIPDWVEEVDCSRNNLTTLNLPEGVKWVDCRGNNFSKEEKARIIKECEERGITLYI
jgi:hypothetical protein